MAKTLTVRRRGECNNCGWCCQFIMVQRVTKNLKLPNGDIDTDLKRFFEMRGGVLGEDGKMRWVMHAFVPCVKHDNESKRCTVYADRPPICRDAPLFPEIVEGTPCSYWFETLDEDGNVIERRGGLGSSYPTPPRFEE